MGQSQIPVNQHMILIGLCEAQGHGEYFNRLFQVSFLIVILALSDQLSEEIEKTDALRVANEGLAARICKLVSFIQDKRNGDDAPTASITTASSSLMFSINSVSSSSEKRSEELERSLEQELIEESLHELASSMNVLNGLSLY